MKKNLLDAPALHLSANGFYVIHPSGVPVVEYTKVEDAYAAYIRLCAIAELGSPNVA